MSLDNSREGAWREMQERNARAREGDPELPLKGGSGGGTYDSLESRVAKLEAYMDASREDMRVLKGDLRTVIDKFATIPTKSDLDAWRWQWLATGIAIVALTVGGITGGLALIAKFAN